MFLEPLGQITSMVTGICVTYKFLRRLLFLSRDLQPIKENPVGPFCPTISIFRSVIRRRPRFPLEVKLSPRTTICCSPAYYYSPVYHAYIVLLTMPILCFYACFFICARALLYVIFFLPSVKRSTPSTL